MRPRKEITAESAAGLLVSSAMVAKLLADYPDAESRLDRAAVLAGAAGHPGIKYRALAEKAALCYVWGRFDQGLELAGRVISEGGPEPDENQASALNTAGNIHLRRCEFDAAEKKFRRALEHYRSLGKEISIGTVINNLANIYNIRGDSRQAEALYREALERFQGQNDIFRTAHVMYSLSQVLLALKETEEAKRCLLVSLDLRRSIQDYRGTVNNLLKQVGIYTDELDYVRAGESLAQADGIIREHRLTDPHLKAYREGEAGLLYFSMGEYGTAEECFLRLIELARPMNEKTYLSRGYFCLGKARVFKNGNGEGIADIKKGIELAESGDLPCELKDAWIYLVESYCRLQQRPQAEEAARCYVREAVKQGDPGEKAEAEMSGILRNQ
ncbi:MAG: tetratricopeptide repeat protein [bacterium]|nr:tetratricopeptide repeat protein [bacterium]